jgi:quinol monooxygenase YgiN
MANPDRCCTLVPYFSIHEGQSDEFKSLCEKFVEATGKEEKVLYYGFTFDGNNAHCREGYEDAEGILTHLGNIGDLFAETLKIADLTRLEVHGPAGELEKLREPLQDLSPQYFTLEYGFRR